MGLGYSQGQPIAAFWKLPNFPNSIETELKLIQHLSILRNSITTKVTYERCQKSHLQTRPQILNFFLYLMLFFLEIFLVCVNISNETKIKHSKHLLCNQALNYPISCSQGDLLLFLSFFLYLFILFFIYLFFPFTIYAQGVY